MILHDKLCFVCWCRLENCFIKIALKQTSLSNIKIGLFPQINQIYYWGIFAREFWITVCRKQKKQEVI